MSLFRVRPLFDRSNYADSAAYGHPRLCLRLLYNANGAPVLSNLWRKITPIGCCPARRSGRWSEALDVERRTTGNQWKRNLPGVHFCAGMVF